MNAKPTKTKQDKQANKIAKAVSLSNIVGHIKKNWVEVNTFVKKTSSIEPKSMGL